MVTPVVSTVMSGGSTQLTELMFVICTHGAGQKKPPSTDEMRSPSPYSLAFGVDGGSPGRVLPQPVAATRTVAASATLAAMRMGCFRFKVALRRASYHSGGRGGRAARDGGLCGQVPPREPGLDAALDLVLLRVHGLDADAHP